MKAEHRKELETNVLADQMGRVLHRMKEGPTRGTVLVGGGVVLVVVLYLVWSLVRSHSENTNSELWEGLNEITTPADLDAFAKEHSSTLQGRLARFKSARLDLAQGLTDLGTPGQRNQALEKVRRAAETYEGLISESAPQPLLQQEAMLNVGKAYEILDNAESAKSFYQQLTRAYPNTVAGRDAETCLKRLEAGAKDLETLKKLTQTVGKPAK